MKKLKIPLIILGIIIVVAAAFFLPGIANKPNPPISSFEECALAGYPIQESYPSRCTTAGGQNFTQDIGNELELTDLITISNPRPNQRITNPIEIRGAARGNWFFEASFPIKLVDENGNIIAEGHAEATEDWMTEEFVPYKAELEFKTKSKTGTLILEKDNPSGETANDNQLKVPVRLK